MSTHAKIRYRYPTFAYVNNLNADRRYFRHSNEHRLSLQKFILTLIIFLAKLLGRRLQPLFRHPWKWGEESCLHSKLRIFHKIVFYFFIEKRIPVKVLKVSNRKTRPSYLPCTAWGPEHTTPTARCDFCDSLLTGPWNRRPRYLQFIAWCDF